ncbi:hypothetical protein OUZ56_014262 [Daphnia magna]|uniref:Uncharacterized protein n=1 Tax=Daphnia magna TaxID=35525 RepID=A0ABR0AJ94_9CRUS|nr:hypothetical protein OUZ56_014262 [Daphnia magna]
MIKLHIGSKKLILTTSNQSRHAHCQIFECWNFAEHGKLSKNVLTATCGLNIVLPLTADLTILMEQAIMSSYKSKGFPEERE